MEAINRFLQAAAGEVLVNDTGHIEHVLHLLVHPLRIVLSFVDMRDQLSHDFGPVLRRNSRKDFIKRLPDYDFKRSGCRLLYVWEDQHP